MNKFKDFLTENTVSSEVKTELLKLIIDSTEDAKEKRTKFISEFIRDCSEFYTTGRWEKFEKAGFDSNFKSPAYNSPAFNAFKKINDDSGYTYQDYTFVFGQLRKNSMDPEQAGKNYVEEEFKDKRAKVLQTILKKFTNEDVVKSMKAKNHNNGFDIDIVLEDGRIEVQNIMAGGFNIQKLHYRTLVKRK